MKLIVVTTPTFFLKKGIVITTLFEEGLDILHLQKAGDSVCIQKRLLTLFGKVSPYVS